MSQVSYLGRKNKLPGEYEEGNKTISHSINIVVYKVFIKRAFLQKIMIDVSNQYQFYYRDPAPSSKSFKF